MEFLDDLLLNPLAVHINDQIFLEILQGAKSEKSFARLRRYFSGQRFCNFGNSRDGHALAAKLYFKCRCKGITIRSSIDCLIAQCAIENKLVLLHQDRDYVKIKTIAPGLGQKHFLN